MTSRGQTTGTKVRQHIQEAIWNIQDIKSLLKPKVVDIKDRRGDRTRTNSFSNLQIKAKRGKRGLKIVGRLHEASKVRKASTTISKIDRTTHLVSKSRIPFSFQNSKKNGAHIVYLLSRGQSSSTVTYDYLTSFFSPLVTLRTSLLVLSFQNSHQTASQTGLTGPRTQPPFSHHQFIYTELTEADQISTKHLETTSARATHQRTRSTDGPSAVTTTKKEGKRKISLLNNND